MSGWGGKGEEYAPPHHSCTRKPLRTLLALIILVLICLVDNLFGDDFLFKRSNCEKARNDIRPSVRGESHAGLTYLDDIYVSPGAMTVIS